MKEYALPEGLWLSFFSKPFYQSVAAIWRGRSAVYLVMLLALCWIPGMIKMHVAFKKGIEMLRVEVAGKFPPLTIVKGEVRTPEPKPYSVQLGDRKGSLILIDTTGQTHSLEDTSAKILVTKTQVFVRQTTAETRIYDLKRIDYLEVNDQTVQRILNKVERWVPLLFYPMAFVFSVIKRFVEASLLAFLGLGLVVWMEAKVDVPALFSLAIVSLTPEIIIWTLLDATGKTFHFQWLCLFVVAIFYFLYALNAATEAPADPL